MSELSKVEAREIGGWLLLVALGVFLGPFIMMLQIAPLYFEIFTNGGWEILTSPDSELYHALWAPFLLTEMLINILLIFIGIYSIILFVGKKKSFPKVYIGVLIFSFGLIFLDAAVYKLIAPDEPMLDPDTMKELIKSGIAAAIWVPYMIVSERVKETFVI